LILGEVCAKAYEFEEGPSPEEARKALWSANPGSLVQTVKAGTIKNRLFVELIAAQTFRAMESGSLLAKKPEIDLLLRLAGTTQISKAIKSQGAVQGEGCLAICAGSKELISPPGFEKHELPRKKLNRSELFRIERAALLDAQKG
jgi:tRNA threonylcarbamoyladenosine modification (KEOPS) complex Cgi121 subunit